MKSDILNELFILEKFKAVNDRNIEKYTKELSKVDSESAIDVKELLSIIKNSGKWQLFEESMSNIKDELLFKSDLHGISHNERVAIFIFAIGILENLRDNDLKILLEAAKYHDIGRVNNGIDGMHGKRSAEKIDLVGLELEEEEKALLKTICICHSSDDEKFDEIFKENNIKDVDRCRKLANILKDADALDRVRLPRTGLDTKYLRTNSAKRMPTGAYELFYNYNDVKKQLEEQDITKLEIKKNIDSKLFNIEQFNVVEDDENYYYFRAVTANDLRDLENKEGLKTNRERAKSRKEETKYQEDDEVSLQEMWDHIRYGHSKETNCISFSSNSNVVIDYGQRDQNKYVMMKVPKAKDGNVYNAGQYMLEEVNKEITKTIERLEKTEGSAETLNILKRIDAQRTYKAVKTIVADAYKGVKATNEKYIGKSTSLRSKESIVSRFEKKQYFSDEQQLEYNKVIAKLTILEALGELRSIIPTQRDNSSLIGTIGMAFSSGEIIHYKSINNNKTMQVSSEMIDMMSLVQQLKEKGINKNSIQALEKEILKLINDEYKLENKIIEKEKQELTIEDIYERTNGKISYYKAKETIEFINNIKQSKLKAREYAEIIRSMDIENAEELAQKVEEECFIIDKDIISRRNNEGIQISESVSISLDRINKRELSNKEKDNLLDIIKQLNTRPDIEKLEEKVLNEILEEKEKISENQYFAEAIADGLDLQKIYKTISDEKRTMTEYERTILVNQLINADCKRLYNSFKAVGAKPSEISGFIVNLLLHGGYKGYSLEELSRLENLDEIISINVKNNNLRHNISALKLDRTLGIIDDAYEVEGTGIRLRDYQQKTLKNIDEIFKEKRFAGMILPTGAGKSFVAMSEIMKFKGKNIVFIAPQRTILHQFEVHILKNILNKKIITEEEIEKLKEAGKPIPKDVVKPEDFKKVLEQEMPSLKMFCYAGLAEKSEEWLEAKDADFIILDELHRSGAETWEPQIKSLIDSNPNAKILGMTATPIRDVDGKDMARTIAKMTGDYTEEELINKEYLASEMHLLEAMQDNYVVNPKIVTFDYNLKLSDEYAEVTKMIEAETNNEKLKELIKIKNEMDSIIQKSEKEGMSGIFTKNIQKKNGKYIVFLPHNPNSKEISSEEYIKYEIAKIQEYFRGVNQNIKTSYLLSDRDDAKSENSKALEEFENSDSDELHLLFAVDMLNEGVHVDGIDGVVMMRPISENSKILYLQQIGRCIFSENPENPTSDEDRPIIFDVYNNYLAQNLDREVNKTNPTSDLQKLKMVVDWIERHGYIPDINSEDLKEARKAVTLKNIQKKYRQYITGIENKNLNESEIREIEGIIELGKYIELWDLEIPDRVIPPGERDISRNDTFKVTGTQREFLDLFKQANQIYKKDKDRSSFNIIRLKSILSLLDVLTEYGIEISNNTIKTKSTLQNIVDSLPAGIRENIKKDIEELYYNYDNDYKIGEEYNFAKERFYIEGNKNSMFKELDFNTLKKYGMFEEFISGLNKKFSIVNSERFITRGTYRKINVDTETVVDKVGFDLDRYYCEKQSDGTYKRKWNKRDFDGDGNYWEKDENGKYINTGGKYNKYHLTVQGFDEEGYYCEREKGLTKRKRDVPFVDKDGICWIKTEKGEFISTGKKLEDYGLNEKGLDSEGYYCEIKEDGIAKRKWKMPYFNAEGRYINSSERYIKSTTNLEGYNAAGLKSNYIREGFDSDRFWCIYEEDGTYKRKWTIPNFDKDGIYWEKDENGDYKRTKREYDSEGYNVYGTDENDFDREEYYCEKQPDGTYKRKWTMPNFDRNGELWEKNKDGILVNTGKIVNNDGITAFGLTAYKWDEERYYCELQKDGVYKRKWTMPNFDGNGEFWQENSNGEYINTEKEYNNEGYNSLGIDNENYDTEGYYCERQEDGSYKRKWLIPDVDENGHRRGTNLDMHGFDEDGYYYKKQEDGTYVNTGKKYNDYGFKSDRKHVITKNAIDLRHFDINGVCKANNDSIYDKNGFKQDGTYLETGEKYHNGYNAYGVDKDGKDVSGKMHYDIVFTQEYIDAVKEGKRTEFIKKSYKTLNTSDIKAIEEKIRIRTYKAQKMYPELEERVKKDILELQKFIAAREIRMKRLIQSRNDANLVVENLKKEIAMLKQKIAYINPMDGIEK